MDLEKIHLIESKDICLCYYYPTADVRVINKSTYKALLALKEGKNINEIFNSDEDKEQILSLIKSIYTLGKDRISSKNTDKRKVIKRITLHVSNDCNLRCTYCFGGGGNYNKPRSLMTEQTAKEFVDFCIEQFERVERIVFFGGEPLLNLTVMELVCNRFKYYKEKGKIALLPKFIVITNGTILTDKIVTFINNNISMVTVSIDGPREINDVQRIYRDGRGSYEKIAQFIHTIKKETNVKIQYEATYTQLHINYGYSHEEISKFLDEKFDIEGVVINEQNLSPQLLLDFWNSIDLEYLRRTKLKYLPKDFWAVLYVLIHNLINPICSVVEKSFAVSSDGTIYPCHTISGIDECKLGTINGTNVYNHPELYKPFDHTVEFRSNDICKKCWMQKLCGGCSLYYFFNHKTNQFETYPNAELCKYTHLYTERMLLIIAYIRKDPELWSLAVQKLND